MSYALIVYPSQIVNQTRIVKISHSVSKLEFIDSLIIVGIHRDGLKEFEAIDSKQQIWRVKLKIPLLIPGLKSITQLIEWYWRIFIKYRKEKISIVHCSSIEDLPIGVFFKLFKKSKLIYDPHEIETETVWLKSIKKNWYKIIESCLISFPDYITVVNNSILQWYKHTYKSIKNIEVILNAPLLLNGNSNVINNKSILRSKININEDDILVIYQGALAKERGVQILLDIFSKIKSGKHIIFMGSGKMEEQIKLYSKKFNNIHYHPLVKIEEVLYYTSGADIGIHLIENTCLNHYYCLPNKVLEYLLSGLPLIVRNYPEMGGLIDKYNCGWKVSDNYDEIFNLINSISHEDIINKKENLLKIQQEINWTNEETKLINIYKKLNVKISSYPHQICSKCILGVDDDPDIFFDENGVCNNCYIYDESVKKYLVKGEEGQKKLDLMVQEIKKYGKNKKYDCIIGVSGGVDSTYVAYLTKQYGLRPLAVHLDNGWNSELAVKNIENILNKLEIPLYTYVLDWEEFKDLQLSYFKASVIDIEVPTDHAIVACLYKTARIHGLKHIIAGWNIVTEGFLPDSWVHNKMDVMNLKDIHKKFGTVKLKTFPLLGFFNFLYYQYVLGIKTFSFLDYLHYNKDDTKKLIMEKLGWRDYGYKHYESIFTRFYQGYILPTKFKVDKRKSHLSTLICSGQLTREDALKLILNPPYDSELLIQDKEFVLKKFSLINKEFENLMDLPIKRHNSYSSYMNIYSKLKPLVRIYKKIKILME